MKYTIHLIAAGALILSPSLSFARPGGGGMGQSMGRGATQMAPTTTHAPQGPTRGAGWDHTNGPTRTGQPGVECEETRPGHAATAPGSAFNEEGTAGTRYAGEQPQNSRNTASISQYDIACLNQPH